MGKVESAIATYYGILIFIVLPVLLAFVISIKYFIGVINTILSPFLEF